MSATRAWTQLALVATMLLLAWPSAAVAQLTNYTFTVIDSGFKDFSVPAINATGMVTFVENPGGVAPVVMRGNGGPLTVIATLTEFASIGPAIDPTGRVIFEHPDGRIVAGDGGPLATLVAPGTAIAFGAGAGTCDVLRLAGRTVNATGVFPVVCSFSAAPSLGKTGLYKANGLSLSRICDEGLDANNFQAFPFCGSIAPVGTSSNALTAFIAFPLDASLTWQSAIAVDSPAGLTEVLLNTDSPGFHFWELAVNDSGSIAFSANRIGDIARSIFLATAAGVQEITPLATPTTPGFLGAITPSINNGGALVFEAAVRTLSGNEVTGVFTGSDPLADRIVQTGDPFMPLGGATVRQVVVGNPGINDAGQIVFVIGLGSGFNAIVRADPVNRPPVVVNPGDQSTPQGQAVTLAISASDPEFDPIVYDANGTLPPGLSMSVGGGVITGTPTAMGIYPVTITVSDPLASSSVTFTWTITEPAPEPRTSLTATPDMQNAAIALAWVNPSPDLAATIEVFAGVVGEPRQLVAVLPASSIDYQFEALGAFEFCFSVVGVSATNVRSGSSNVACATNPQLQISNVMITPTATTATIAWNTNMAASGSVLYGLAGQPLGNLTPATGTAGGTAHAVELIGLIPGANYVVQVRAQSTVSGQLVTTNSSFTTPSGGSLTADLRVTIVPTPPQIEGDPESRTMTIDVMVSNHRSASATAHNVRVDARSFAEWRCRQPEFGSCSEEIVQAALISAVPASMGSLAPGQSATARLTFRFFPATVFTTGGIATLHVVVGHEYFDGVGTVERFPTHPLRAQLPPGLAPPIPTSSADLKFSLLSVVPVIDPTHPFDVQLHFIVVNDGPDDARDVHFEMTFPVGTSFVRLLDRTAGVQCSFAVRRLLCSLPVLHATPRRGAARHTMSVKAVLSSAARGERVDVAVTSEDLHTIDPFPSDNVAELAIPVECAGLLACP